MGKGDGISQAFTSEVKETEKLYNLEVVPEEDKNSIYHLLFTFQKKKGNYENADDDTGKGI